MIPCLIVASSGVITFGGPIVTAEEPNGTIVQVGVVSSVIPSNLTFKANATTVFYFVAAFRYVANN